jgi:coenzyme F420-reducing hydrogenase beta subunit
MSRFKRVSYSGERRIAVIGGTFSGNKGASAMLESVLYNLRHLLHGNVTFDIISVYPKRDSGRPLPDWATLVPAPPAALIFILPLAAACYAILRRLRLPGAFLKRYPLLDSVAGSDAILDIEGISFVDGRLPTLLYNIACSLPGIICGTPVIRLSQAFGPLETRINRAAARFILSRCGMVFARGRETARQLESAGISDFRPAADLAFILSDHVPPSDDKIAGLNGEEGILIGAAPSQVLADELEASGIDLASLLAGVLDDAVESSGGKVVLLAHSWLGEEKRSRNNDYHICRTTLERMRRKDRAVFLDSDLSASALREAISRFDCFIACRFHSMISALCVGTPCVVPAWSHKYREVMEEFGLGEFVLEKADIGHGRLIGTLHELLGGRERIRSAIAEAMPPVRASAWSQLELAARFLDEAGISFRTGGRPGRLYREIYGKDLHEAYIGYSADPEIREGAASGGLVTTLLAGLLERGEIDGVIAARTVSGEAGLEFETVLCTTMEEILDCRTSIYSDFNHASGIIEILRSAEGKFAAVALPCQWTWIDRWLGRNPWRRGEIALRIGLWCGHATGRRLIDDFLALRKIGPQEIERLWYRRGSWRGATEVLLTGGGVRRIPFSRGYGLLQNLYVDCRGRCFSCEDHFASNSDISFGDAWLPEMKARRIKHSMAVALTKKGVEAGRALAASPGARVSEVPPELAVRAQKRAVIWHTYGTAGRERVCRYFGAFAKGSGRFKARWNDVASAAMIFLAWKAFSGRARPVLLRLPWPLHYVYMLVQKTFLNF